MSSIVYLKNKKSGHVYAYESTSFRDPVTRKPKAKRRYLGRVDAESKQFLNPDDAKKISHSEDSKIQNPTETSNKAPKDASQVEDQTALVKEINQLKKTIRAQSNEILSIKKEQREVKKLLGTIERAIHVSLQP